MAAMRQPFLGNGWGENVFCNPDNDLVAYGVGWSCQELWAMLVYRFGRWHWGFEVAIVRKHYQRGFLTG